MLRSIFRFIVLIIFWMLSPSAFAKDIKIEQSVFDNESLPIQAHSGEGPFDSYLVMNVQYRPVQKVFAALKKRLRLKLISRGEAHITVITPVEFRPHLESKMTISEIDEIAKRFDIQKAKFEILGLGSGSAVIEGKKEETFFIVVKSDDLTAIRKAVQKAFVAKGGDPKLFDPLKFYPHITVGFTKQDLHESDGVIKDANSVDKRVQLLLQPR